MTGALPSAYESWLLCGAWGRARLGPGATLFSRTVTAARGGGLLEIRYGDPVLAPGPHAPRLR